MSPCQSAFNCVMAGLGSPQDDLECDLSVRKIASYVVNINSKDVLSAPSHVQVGLPDDGGVSLGALSERVDVCSSCVT